MFTELLLKLFVKDYEEDAKRYEYGKFAGIVGIVSNAILVVIKLVAGLVSGSVAIIADAINNLSDAGSSVVTLVGFKLASAPPDEDHPFGHGRMEYISALGIGVLIIIAGIELARSSIGKILNPTELNFTILTIAILLLSIFIKLWMMSFNNKLGKEINSNTLIATAIDSRNDVIVTSIILIAEIVSYYSGFALDGYIGIIVAVFVAWSGIAILRDTVSPLIGITPSKELVNGIKNLALSKDGVLDVHDILIHNYGPEKFFISFHAEVSSNADFMESHNMIDKIEQELQEKYNAIVTIHMDPIDVDDKRIIELNKEIEKIIKEIDPVLSFHDFRAVFGEKRTTVIFDLVIPFEYNRSKTIKKDIQQKVWEMYPNIIVSIIFDHSYV